jgi:pimeloyl-ACP methyl ester carboxylesterase
MMKNPSRSFKNFAEATTPKGLLLGTFLRWSLTILINIMGLMHSIRSNYAAVEEESKRRQLRSAESGLLRLYPPDDGTAIVEAVSTKIPRSAVHEDRHAAAAGGPPSQCLPGMSCSHRNRDNENGDGDGGDLYYLIHTLKITGRRNSMTQTQQKSKEELQEEPPLVLLHGYMNGAGYFYRNFAGLARSFPQTYALDLLGWGLSSRPKWPVLRKTTTGDDPLDPIAASERFFCNSLEAWRETMHIDKMILAGHSMGGYLAVAYAERYPHRVDRLVLISPVGVPVESVATIEKRSHQRRTASLSARFAAGIWHFIYRFGTPGDVLRYLPAGIGRSRLQWYVEKRLPAIDRAEEQKLLADYLYHNATLPGSGEYCLQHLLTASLYGKRPLVERIPHLPIAACHFLYGEYDWMDASAGLDVQERCGRLRQKRFFDQDRNGRDDTATTAQHPPPPKVTVHRVRNAGHLLMLDNPDEFNNGLAMVASRSPALVVGSPIPIELRPWTTAGTSSSSSTQHSSGSNASAANDGGDNKDE